MTEYTMLLWILFAFFHTAQTAKILLHFMPLTSHCLEMVAIGNELTNRGHSVAAYVPNFFKTAYCFRDSTIKVITFDVSESNEALFNLATTGLEKNVVTKEKGTLQLMSELGNSVNALCDSLLSNRPQLDRLKKEKYDIVMTDSLPFCHCYYLVPYYMGVRTVSVSSFIDDFDSGAVFQPGVYPHPFGSYTNQMNTFQRILNSVQYIMFAFLFPVFRGSFDTTKYGEPFTNVDPDSLIRESSLYLENSDYIADYPKANFPNFIQVGGLTAKSPAPLPKDLRTYLDSSKTGVIVISFGSILKHASPLLIKGIVSALKQLPHDVLFKLDSNSQDENIKIVDWLPLNDVIAHPHVKLFISHCGRNSFFESLYHGVPIVCTPLNGDAFQTAIKVVHHKIGASLDIIATKPEEMVAILKSVLNDKTIYSNMQSASKLFRDRPETGAQRGASAVEHIIKYGDQHLKPTTRKLNYFQYTFSDIWFVIYSLLLVLFCGVVGLAKCICCRKKAVSISSKKKSN